MRHTSTIKAAVTLAAFCGAIAVAVSAAGQTVYVRPGPSSSRIGVATRDVTREDVARDKLPGEFGAYVNDVEAGAPAEKAGLHTGDVIVEFDGVRVRSSAELQRLITETPADRSVRVGVMRNGKRLEVTITTEANANGRGFWLQTPEGRQFFPTPTPEFREGPLQRPFTYRFYPDFPPNRSPRSGGRLRVPTPMPLPNTPRLGISVQDLTPQLAEYFHTKEGVLVATVEDGSQAARAGLKAGDIITSIEGEAVSNADNLTRMIREKRAGDEVALGVVRDGKPLTIKATLASGGRGAVGRF